MSLVVQDCGSGCLGGICCEDFEGEGGDVGCESGEGVFSERCWRWGDVEAGGPGAEEGGVEV